LFLVDEPIGSFFSELFYFHFYIIEFGPTEKKKKKEHTIMATKLTTVVKLSVAHAEAVELVVAKLAEVKFGVLTRIDAQATLRAKIQREIPPMVMLGACNPGIAAGVMDAAPAAATLLPCTVVVKELPEG
jgi:uncharacterized protein (DUF302 family)